MLGRASGPMGALDEDVRAVHGAATLLRIPEFAFFRLAYRRWYGREASDAVIEPHFARYLFARRAPYWARHLAREVGERAMRGPVGPRDYGLEPLLPPPPSRRTEGFRQLFLAVVYGACFALVTLCAL